MKKDFRFHCARRIYRNDIALAMFRHEENHRVSFARTALFETLDEGSLPPEDTFLSLSQTEAQELMDELYRCGVRPSDGTGSAGAMAACQEHLKDMRTLAFKLVDHTIAGK